MTTTATDNHSQLNDNTLAVKKAKTTNETTNKAKTHDVKRLDKIRTMVQSLINRPENATMSGYYSEENKSKSIAVLKDPEMLQIMRKTCEIVARIVNLEYRTALLADETDLFIDTYSFIHNRLLEKGFNCEHWEDIYSQRPDRLFSSIVSSKARDCIKKKNNDEKHARCDRFIKADSTKRFVDQFETQELDPAMKLLLQEKNALIIHFQEDLAIDLALNTDILSDNQRLIWLGFNAPEKLTLSHFKKANLRGMKGYELIFKQFEDNLEQLQELIATDNQKMSQVKNYWVYLLYAECSYEDMLKADTEEAKTLTVNGKRTKKTWLERMRDNRIRKNINRTDALLWRQIFKQLVTTRPDNFDGYDRLYLDFVLLSVHKMKNDLPTERKGKNLFHTLMFVEDWTIKNRINKRQQSPSDCNSLYRFLFSA